MSLRSMCSVHSVDVLDLATTTDAMMGLSRSYTKSRSITCRVMPKDAIPGTQLGEVSQVIPHEIWTVDDPLLTERQRLSWNGAILRIVRVPRQPHGQGRVWVTWAEARSEDNPVPTELD